MRNQSLTLLGSLLLAANTHAAVTSGLVAYYDFQAAASGDGAAVTNQAQAVGSDYAGTFTNATIFGSTPTSGFSGNAAFNSNAGAGTTDRSGLLIGNSANFSHNSTDTIRTGLSSTILGTDYSVSMWFNAKIDPDAATGQRYFLFEDGTNATNFEISAGSPGTNAGVSNITITNYINSSTGQSIASSPTTNAWHHGVWVYSNTTTTPTVTFYLDNVLVNSFSAASGQTLSFDDINIGNARDTMGRGWDGMIDEVAIYNRALSASDVQELRNIGLNGQAIPEPSVALLGGLGALCLLRRRR